MKQKNKDTTETRGGEPSGSDPVHSPEAQLRPENPGAFYDMPAFARQATSRWEVFARFSHRHKRVVYGMLALATCAALGAAGLAGGALRPERLLKAYYTEFAQAAPDWAYRVAGISATDRQMRALYTTMAEYRLGPEAAARARSGSGYREFLRAEADADLLVLTALRNGTLETPEARQIIMHELRRVAAEYVIYEKLRARGFSQKLHPDLSPPAVERFLRERPDYFARNRLSGDRARESARSIIAAEHRARVAAEVSQEQRAILAALREKSGYQLRE